MTSGYVKQKTVWWTFVYLALITLGWYAVDHPVGGVLVFVGVIAATLKEYDRFPGDD